MKPICLSAHKKKNKKGAADNTGIKHMLSRLGCEKNSAQSLKLSIADGFEGKGWTENGPHGLRPGEGLLLKYYAELRQIEERFWPNWLKDAT